MGRTPRQIKVVSDDGFRSAIIKEIPEAEQTTPRMAWEVIYFSAGEEQKLHLFFCTIEEAFLDITREFEIDTYSYHPRGSI